MDEVCSVLDRAEKPRTKWGEKGMERIDPERHHFTILLDHVILDESYVEELLVRVRQGGDDGEAAANELVLHHLRLVNSYAKRFGRRVGVLSTSDFFNEGALSLHQAVRKHEPSKGEFLFYVRKSVRRGMIRLIARQGSVVRAPINLQGELKRRQREAKKDLDAGGAEQCVAENQNERKALIAMQGAVSINSESSRSENGTSIEQLLSSGTARPDTDVAWRDLRTHLVELMRSCLTRREFIILARNSGLFGCTPKSYEEIGNDVLCLSRERVRKIREGALQKLKRKLKNLAPD